MKNNIRAILCLISAVGITATLGCTDELTPPVADNQATGTQTPILIGASYPTLTRASDSGFEDGDVMGVFLLDYDADNDESQSISGESVHGRNVKYRFNASDNGWTSATTLYWSSPSTPADIIAYYPFTASAADMPETIPFTVGRRQDLVSTETTMGDYEAADMLWGKSSKVMPTASRIDITLNHLMAGVRIELTKGSGFTDTEWTEVSKTVLVSNVCNQASINLAAGSASVVGNSSTVSISPLLAGGQWRAVVVPQTIDAGTPLVQLEVDGASYSLAKDNTFTYNSGKLHTFTIIVNKRAEDGTIEFAPGGEVIEPWIDSAEFRDGIIRQYVTVDVPSRGGLAEAVAQKGIVPSSVQNLKLTGELNNRDFDYIRDNFQNTNAINLYEAEVYHDNQPQTLPERAFSYMGSLHHVVFPRKLKVIGTCAFTGSGLMGDLIIPEGVTKIGWQDDPDSGGPGHSGGGDGVFAYCNYINGELSLPSTLEFIENAAFFRTNLQGDLIIPDGVTYIGSMAFDETKFTGRLVLPENLKVLGKGAFFCVPLSGDLIIPQGIDKIRDLTFVEGKYTRVSLPEGLTEIEAEAFSRCSLRGELVLPSTLKIIDSRAFKDNSFSRVIFNENLTYLGYGAFSGNTRLQGTVTIPRGIKQILRSTFADCHMLEEIVLHDEITLIDGGAFQNCYNLTSIVSDNPEPPLLQYYRIDDNVNRKVYPFDGVPKDNFTVQVPGQSIALYKSDAGWGEFKRIAEYSNFVCRPQKVCALNTNKQIEVVLNADGPWSIASKPDWCSVSPASGNGKSRLSITIDRMSRGAGDRQEAIVFSLDGTEITTECVISQYDYEYAEDECITLQRADVGNGINLVFVAEGYDAETISRGDYLSLVNKQMEAFFGIEPYTAYRNRFNVYACVSLSQENGVNTANVWRDTRFKTLYSQSSASLLLDDPDAVTNYVIDNTPVTSQNIGRAQIIMTLNSEDYGGYTHIFENGCAVSVCPPSIESYPMDTRGVVQREACGLGFGKLADERVTKNQYIPKAMIQHINERKQRGWYKNISISSHMAGVDWQHFIFDPRYSVVVDIYEGGFGYSRGVFRSEPNSCMTTGIPYFNAISRQAIVERILDYSGEGFSMEKFYETDNDNWGTTEL